MSIKSKERKARNERIQSAFSGALRIEKEPFILKGQGYEPRTTLKSHISRIVSDLPLPYASVSQGPSWRYYYPLRLVKRAAELMNVKPSEFTSTINWAGRYWELTELHRALARKPSWRKASAKSRHSPQLALSFPTDVS